MDTSFEIARYEPVHKEQVLRLQRHLWGRDDARNRAYFAWKYERNPYLPDPAISLALHGGKVVGMRGIVGARWQLGSSGRSVLMPFTDDFAIAPEHRDKGLATSLTRAACAYAADLGHPYLLSLRSGPITLLASLAAGYRSIEAMKPVGLSGDVPPGAYRVSQRLRTMRFLWRFADSSLLLAPSDRRPFLALERRAPGGDAHIAVERTPRSAAMADLVGRLSPDDRIHHVRDRGFFDWVFDNPRLEYRFLYRSSEQLDGFLVLHRQLPVRAGPVTVWVADWDGTTDVVRRELLEAAAAGGFARLATWTATYPDSVRTMLDERGFEPTELEARARGRPAALIRPTRDDELDGDWELDGRRLMDPASWKFRLLDQD